MSERIAYFCGLYVSENEVKISIADRGFVNGDAAFDVARSFNHQPFQWKEHISRWFDSLDYMQIGIGMTQNGVYNITFEVFKRNEHLLSSNDDCWIRWVGTPGEHRLGPVIEPTVLIYSPPIPFESYAQGYIDGVHLIVVSTRAIPPQCFDAKAKLYSRAHYVLAEVEAHGVDPEAIPVLLDINGHVAECPRQNIFLVKEGRLLTPTRNSILQGVTRATTLELAKQLALEAVEMDLCPYDLFTADEIFVTATSYVMLPVGKLNNRLLDQPVPGPITRQLLAAWNDLVGLDIAQQALDHLQAGESDS